MGVHRLFYVYQQHYSMKAQGKKHAGLTVDRFGGRKLWAVGVLGPKRAKRRRFPTGKCCCMVIPRIEEE